MREYLASRLERSERNVDSFLGRQMSNGKDTTIGLGQLLERDQFILLSGIGAVTKHGQIPCNPFDPKNHLSASTAWRQEHPRSGEM